jgi:hypothetical protein
MKTEPRKQQRRRSIPERRLYKIFDGETYVIRALPIKKKGKQ